MDSTASPRAAATGPTTTTTTLPVAAWVRVVAFLAPLERACVRRACGLRQVDANAGMDALAHVADFHGDGVDDDDAAATLLLAMAMAKCCQRSTAAATAVASGDHQLAQCDWHPHQRFCHGLTCGLYGARGPNGEPSPPSWTHLLALLTAASPVGFGPPAPPPPGPLRGGRESHFSTCDATEMSARQIVPQAEPSRAKLPPHASKRPPRGDGSDAVVAASSSSSTSTSALAMLFQRLALARRRRAQLKQDELQQQRASWPCVRADARVKDSFARRAQQSIANALAALQRDSSASSSSSASSRLAPPQFVLRAQRRLSQRFNHKIVRAVGKDVRRSESQRRSSLTLLEAPHSTSSFSSASGDDDDDGTEDEFPLRMSERLSLSLGRRLSRDFAPMLTEGSALECRVRELVYGLLRDPAALEGHVCARFFARQEAFTSPAPAACRFYLARVRDTISDLVQFISEYRLRELGDEFLPFFAPDNQDDHDDQDSAEAFAQELERAVRRAVEEYFMFSLRYEIRTWCRNTAAVGSTSAERAAFRKTLARWRALPATSAAFALKTRDAALASQPLVARAIEQLRALETTATPSRKMENLLAASHALSAFLAHSRASFAGAAHPPAAPLSPSARVCLGDADSFLPLLIFAVSRCELRAAHALCAELHGLFPFASQHGERMYYLTMFEAALEFMRNAPTTQTTATDA